MPIFCGVRIYLEASELFAVKSINGPPAGARIIIICLMRVHGLHTNGEGEYTLISVREKMIPRLWLNLRYPYTEVGAQVHRCAWDVLLQPGPHPYLRSRYIKYPRERAYTVGKFDSPHTIF
jgi:hypothetical protein